MMLLSLLAFLAPKDFRTHADCIRASTKCVRAVSGKSIAQKIKIPDRHRSCSAHTLGEDARRPRTHLCPGCLMPLASEAWPSQSRQEQRMEVTIESSHSQTLFNSCGGGDS
eukprot:508039-Pelagomonas_calceolata.AAC.7